MRDVVLSGGRGRHRFRNVSGVLIESSRLRAGDLLLARAAVVCPVVRAARLDCLRCGCPVLADVLALGPIPFSRYLEKNNRQDRDDLSRTAVARPVGALVDCWA